MTRDELLEAGYLLEATCPPPCGSPDSLFRRPWQCEHEEVKRRREELTTQQDKLKACQAGPECLLHTRAWFAHPEEQWPLPHEGTLTIFEEVVDGNVPPVLDPAAWKMGR